uniref:SET domain-containing protein n=1 Tax=Macrostomum lignano TaxID=282301 RepID=A0A1I8HXK6_9PLAT
NFFQQNLEFHDSLVIQRSPECGRYAVAKRPLVKGEILYKELPYCTVLLRHCWPYFCYHCLAPLALATKPQPQSVCCNDCGIRFCDADCCRRASDYHRFECADLDLIESTGIGHLAYRILLTACTSLSPSGASQWLAGAPVPRCFPADYSAVDGLCDNAEHHQLDDVAKYRQ